MTRLILYLKQILMNVLVIQICVSMVCASTLLVVTIAPALKITSLLMMEEPVPVSGSIHL